MSNTIYHNREETRRALRTLLGLPRPVFEPYRDALPRTRMPAALFEAARDTNYAVRHISNTLASLREAENTLREANARLVTNLECITDYVHDHVADLNPYLYHILATTDPDHIPSLSALRSATARAPTPYPAPATQHYDDAPASPTRAAQEAAEHRTTARQERRHQRVARFAYPIDRTPGHSQDASPPTTSEPSHHSSESLSARGVSGTWDDYLHDQESRYGRDEDGDVRLVDRWIGVDDSAHDGDDEDDVVL